ncbi:MAG: hypothetical protein LBT21_01070 [Oscillospiraceae bacterium]|jgi:hypothetical protein|nr:hypothetical protein [Oscillospiraceae bacterium]
MSLVLPRLIVGALGLLLAVLTFLLPRLKRLAVRRVIAVLGGAGAVGLLIAAGQQFASASDAVRWGTLVPWFALGLFVTAQFVTALLKAPLKLNAALLIISVIQFGLASYFLVSRWRNLTVGEPMWLYLQIALAALLAVSTVLYALAALNGKRHG